MKHGKASKTKLALVMNLIGGEDGASFVDNQSEVKQNQSWIPFDTQLKIALGIRNP